MERLRKTDPSSHQGLLYILNSQTESAFPEDSQKQNIYKTGFKKYMYLLFKEQFLPDGISYHFRFPPQIINRTIIEMSAFRAGEMA